MLANRAPRIVFDLTTSARWHGPAVGIVQVQREIGRFAPQVASATVEYALYDVRRKAFYRLRTELAAEILDGGIVVRFPRHEPPTSQPLSNRMSWVLRNPRRFVKGRLRRLRHPAPPPQRAEVGDDLPGVNRIDIDDAVDGILDLGASDVLVTCGADWAGRDLPAILEAKERDGFRYVAMCYDVIPWRHPQFFPQGVAESVISYYADAAWVADLVMCISQSTAGEFAQFCDDLDIPRPKLGTFRLGDTKGSPSKQATVPRALEGSRFVLCVGALEPRKNHRLLYNVWDALCRDSSFPHDVKLVFVASAEWMTDDLRLEMTLNPYTRDRIVVLDRATDDELAALYGACLFTLYPSLHEGWGLPIAESLSHGKVCVASNRGSMPEISRLTLLLDPHDFEAWSATVRRLVADAGAREQLEAQIRHEYVPTPWDAAARSFFSTAFAELAS
jgi:glycosyltransferase involved in cell wall biosynthesis